MGAVVPGMGQEPGSELEVTIKKQEVRRASPKLVPVEAWGECVALWCSVKHFLKLISKHLT